MKALILDCKKYKSKIGKWENHSTDVPAEPVKNKKDLFLFAVYALFGIVANQYMFVKGVSYTLSANASILISTIPVFTIIFAFLLKYEGLSLIKILGILFAFSGAGLLTGVENLEFTAYLKGNLLILANSACFAIYLVISKPMLIKYRPYTVITYMYLFGVIMITPLTFSHVVNTPYHAIPFRGYAPLFAVVFLGTFIPYLINKLILQKTVSSVVAIYTYIQPLAGSILAMLFLNEPLSVKLVLSGILILFGVTLSSFHKAFAFPHLYIFLRGAFGGNKRNNIRN